METKVNMQSKQAVQRIAVLCEEVIATVYKADSTPVLVVVYYMI